MKETKKSSNSSSTTSMMSSTTTNIKFKNLNPNNPFHARILENFKLNTYKKKIKK